MKKYLVVWSGDDGVIVQSLVEIEIEHDPKAISQLEWVKLAALSEDSALEDYNTFDLFLVIDYPETFYI